MNETRSHKHSEVQQSSGEIRPCQCVQETDHHKGNDVLQIILMAPVIKEQNSLRIFPINRLNEDRLVLFYYLRTRSTSGLVWSIFFLSSGSFLAIAVSSQFEKACMMNRKTLIIMLRNNTIILALDSMFKVNFNIMQNESVTCFFIAIYIKLNFLNQSHLSGYPEVSSQRSHEHHFENDNSGICGEGQEHITVYQVGHFSKFPSKDNI